MATTVLTSFASKWGADVRHVNFNVRSSVPTSGSVTDINSQGYWRVYRNQNLVASANGVLDYAFIGQHNDELKVKYIDHYGNEGSWETYIFSANDSYNYQYYVDNTFTGTPNGTSSAPYSGIHAAVNALTAVLPTSGIGSINLKAGQTFPLSNTLWFGDNTNPKLIRMLKWGEGSNPLVQATTNNHVFSPGRKASIHSDSVDYSGFTASSNAAYCFDLRKQSAGDRTGGFHFMVRNCNIYNYYNSINAYDGASGYVVQNVGIGYYDYFAVENVNFVSSFVRFIDELHSAKYIYINNVSATRHTSNQAGDCMRMLSVQHGYFKELYLANWVSSNYAFGLSLHNVQGASATSPDHGNRYLSFDKLMIGNASYDPFINSSVGGGGYFELGAGGNNQVAYNNDIRIINSRFRHYANAAIMFGNNQWGGKAINNFQFVNTIIEQNIQIDTPSPTSIPLNPNMSSVHYSSIEFDHCLLIMTGDNFLYHTGLSGQNSVLDGCYKFTNCLFYNSLRTPQIGVAPFMTVQNWVSPYNAQMALSKIGKFYNNVFCPYQRTSNWTTSTSPYTSHGFILSNESTGSVDLVSGISGLESSGLASGNLFLSYLSSLNIFNDGFSGSRQYTNTEDWRFSSTTSPLMNNGFGLSNKAVDLYGLVRTTTAHDVGLAEYSTTYPDQYNYINYLYDLLLAISPLRVT